MAKSKKKTIRFNQEKLFSDESKSKEEQLYDLMFNNKNAIRLHKKKKFYEGKRNNKPGKTLQSGEFD